MILDESEYTTKANLLYLFLLLALVAFQNRISCSLRKFHRYLQKCENQQWVMTEQVHACTYMYTHIIKSLILTECTANSDSSLSNKNKNIFIMVQNQYGLTLIYHWYSLPQFNRCSAKLRYIFTLQKQKSAVAKWHFHCWSFLLQLQTLEVILKQSNQLSKCVGTKLPFVFVAAEHVVNLQQQKRPVI